MSEKSVLPSRFFSCLIAGAMFILILSSLFLYIFGDNSLKPSVFENIDVHSPSINFESFVTSENTQPPNLSSVAPPISIDQTLVGQQILHENSSLRKMDSLERDRETVCHPNKAILRVYMYDLPPEYHFGLLGWVGAPNQVWPDVSNRSQIPSYPGGLNLQHSIEYWLTLDLLLSNTRDELRPCTAIRVQNPNEADVIYVPFFSSLTYNRYSKILGKGKVSVNRLLQDKLVEFLKGRLEWRRSGGKDHLIIAHHPNSMFTARRKLGSAMFVLADFGRYPTKLANLQKDVIAPYKHLVMTTPAINSTPFDDRPILVYFRGAIYRKDGGTIRQELYYLLKDEKDVHFTFGSVQAHGIRQAGQGMGSSKFCLNIAGDTPSSNRLFDAIATHCVPVIISDDIELPFEDVLDYSEFCVFVRATDAVKKGYLLKLLRRIDKDRWTKMWNRLKEIEKHFEYQFPSRPGDAVDMIWGVVSRKLSSAQNDINRKNRYSRSQLLLQTH